MPREGPATEEASQKMNLFRHEMAIAGPKAGFVSHLTASGHSLGSLDHYSMGWNLADAGEVTSSLTLGGDRLHPAASGTLKRKITSVMQALEDVNKTADVSSLPNFFLHRTYVYSPSPRDSGLVSIT